jgi:uroporphyrinogen-III synthase
MRSLNILVTRPEPGASATAARLQSLGHRAVLAPCLTITPRSPHLPVDPTAIIITSGQAVPALPASYTAIPVFCVGDATAARLHEAGFHDVLSASGDAEDLYQLIIAHRRAGTHLLATGERHGLALAAQLREAGFNVLRRAVYAASPVKALTRDAQTALADGEIDAALFYSAETVRAFARLRPGRTETIMALALSEAVAAKLRDLPWSAIHVALAPTEADLLALLK